MKVVIPKTRSTLKMLEPMILPTARSDFFLKAATAEVASSGKEVPAARIVRPINFSLTSKCLAIMTAFSIMSWPPKMRPAIPPVIIKVVFKLPKRGILSSDVVSGFLLIFKNI